MKQLVMALSLVVLAAETGQSQQTGGAVNRIVAAIDRHVFESHFRFLSDDVFEGRGPGTRGGRLAAEYIATQFERIGLTPAGADSGWFQPFALMSGRNLRSELAAGNETFLAAREQALAVLGDSAREYRGSAVFVGYGIVAPEFQWDDYKDVDVRGKLVIAIAGHPGQADSTIFNAPNNYGTRLYKTREALKHGAAGALIIHRTQDGFPWERISRFWFEEGVMAADLQVSRAPAGLSGWIREAAAERLFRAAGLDLSAIAGTSRSRAFRPVPVNVEVRAAAATRNRPFEGRNVVGVLPGRGEHANEVVILGGHYDHLGIGSTPVAGDSIYNGAEDNANGIAALLTVAEAMMHANVASRRSILFIAFDAEEAGLLGSAAYVRDPLFPLVQTVGMINLDGINVYSKTSDTWSLGLEYSTLATVYRSAAKAEGLEVQLSQSERKFLEDQQFFTRSDHYNFARAGVPSLFIWGGYTAIGRPQGWMQQKLEEYLSTRYHQPSDEIQDWYSFEGTMTDLRILARTIYAVASTPQPPVWFIDSPYQRKPSTP